ncbi:MAG: cation transporter [Gemmatimonadota bacterium]|jgi:copper chaperone|nr:cation transporter [Gemmatimonadota bacterium]
MRPLTLSIEGMSCHHCLNAVNKALSGLGGVTIRAVRIGRAELEYDETAIQPEAVAAAVTTAGYRATPVAD